MDASKIEADCTNLSALLKNTIRQKILQKPTPTPDYTAGEALVFWLADMLTGTRLITGDQVRLVLDELGRHVANYGNMLEPSVVNTTNTEAKELPVCKIGFLDRQSVCMDGWNYFLNLTTGEKAKATRTWPLETIAYNLTTLFVKRRQAFLSSAELEVSHAAS